MPPRKKKETIGHTQGYLYALDISMKCSGITIFDLKTLSPVLITSISTEHFGTKPQHGKKLKFIGDELTKIIEQYPPSIVSAERGFSRFNTETQTIYRSVGVFNYLLHNFEFEYFSPKTVKAEICRGDATKKYVQDTILKKYPEINFKNEDESDSFAVGLTYLIKHNLIEWDKPVVVNKPKATRKKKEDKK